MSKQVISVDGEQRMVREDTARSYRAVYWALFSLLGFIIIAAILFLGGFLHTVSNGTTDKPATIDSRNAAR
jgi:hypothetical protein